MADPTPKSLAEYLREVAENPTLLESLRAPGADLAAILARSGLSEEDQQILLTNDREAIADIVGKDFFKIFPWWFF